MNNMEGFLHLLKQTGSGVGSAASKGKNLTGERVLHSSLLPLVADEARLKGKY